MPNPVVHFEIIGKDQPLLESFYRDIFGWKIAPMMEGYSLVDTQTKTGIAGGIGAGDESHRHLTFYVSVSDIEAALVAIETKGGARAFGPNPLPDGGIIAGFLDPENHLIGLIQPPPGM
jgi:uncharacterized protein